MTLPNTKQGFNDIAYGRIKASLGSTDTSFELLKGYVYPFLPGWASDKELLSTFRGPDGSLEIIKIIDIFGHRLTVERGQDGTVARNWPAGSLLTQRAAGETLGKIIQKGEFRSVTYNPNGVLSGAYPGEKIYESGAQSCQVRWWLNNGGTKWRLLAGVKCDWEYYDGDGYIQGACYMIHSNATDGDCGMRGEASWLLARDPAVSEDCNTGASFYSYAVNALRIFGTWYCSRSWFDFDLSPISSGLSIVSATLRFKTDCTYSDTACLQEGIQEIPMTVNDFQAFTGSILGQKVLHEGVNTIDFNAAGLSYLESVLGSTAKICMREYDFDYLNIAPGIQGGHIGIYYSETPSGDDKPMLTINV